QRGEMLTLHAQPRPRQLCQAEIAADKRMEVPPLAAMHAQNPHALRETLRLRDAHACVAESAEILGREERQAADVADAAGATPIRERGADRLRRVLDHGEPVLARDRVE